MRKCLLLFWALCLLVGCKSHENGKPTIAVSIEPYRYFAEQIVGDRYNVVTMVPQNSSPETYEPTAQQMMSIAHSTLYVKVGRLGFEQIWMKRLENTAPHLIVVDSSEGILIAEDTGTIDPHVWTSPNNALQIAKNIYKAVVALNQKDSLYYKANLKRLITKIAEIDKTMDGLLKGKHGKSFLIYHPALTYLASDYGLKQIAVENEGREPSAAQLHSIIEEAKRDSVKLMFVQKQFGNRNVEVVAKSTNTKQVEINPLNYHWDKEMVSIAKALCRNL